MLAFMLNDRHAHTQMIDRMGGTAAVAAALGQTQSTISNWRRRGIPWRVRPRLARLAVRRGIKLPVNFLGLNHWRTKVAKLAVRR